MGLKKCKYIPIGNRLCNHLCVNRLRSTNASFLANGASCCSKSTTALTLIITVYNRDASTGKTKKCGLNTKRNYIPASCWVVG